MWDALLESSWKHNYIIVQYWILLSRKYYFYFLIKNYQNYTTKNNNECCYWQNRSLMFKLLSQSIKKESQRWTHDVGKKCNLKSFVLHWWYKEKNKWFSSTSQWVFRFFPMWWFCNSSWNLECSRRLDSFLLILDSKTFANKQYKV